MKFDKDDGDLFLQLTFNADQIAGSYTFTFWDKEGRDVINQRGRIIEHVPVIPLPSPAFMNDGGMIEVNATIVGLVEPGEGVNYQVSGLVSQGDKPLGEPALDSKPLGPAKQVGTIFIFLDMVDTEPAETA